MYELNSILEKLKKSNNGWEIFIRINLDEDEVKSLDIDALEKIEDWKTSIRDNNILFVGDFNRSEPWEDEPPEEFVKAAIYELEWRVTKLLK